MLFRPFIQRALLRSAFVLGLSGAAVAQSPIDPVFTYQGMLLDGGSPATGLYDVQFCLFEQPGATNVLACMSVLDDVPVEDGLFATDLSFAPADLREGQRYLEVRLRAGDSNGGFTALSPRQALRPAPYALHALNALPGSVDADSIVAGAIAGEQLANGAVQAQHLVDNAVTSGKIAAGAVGSSEIDPAQVQRRVADACQEGYIRSIASNGSVECGTPWQLGGNAGTTATDFIGTTDARPLVFRVNNVPALRLQPHADVIDGVPVATSVIAGGAANVMAPSVRGGTIAGGGNTHLAPGLAKPNTVFGDYGTIGGGSGNITGLVDFPTSSTHGVVAGGHNNSARGRYAAVGGGDANGGDGYYASVSGGRENCAGGDYSWAGGYRAKIRRSTFSTTPDPGCAGVPSGGAEGDRGTFAWSDANLSASQLVSTGQNQFLVRAGGGVWFGTHGAVSLPAARFINTSTGAYLSSGGAWTNSSSRSLKTDFVPADPIAVLDKVLALPMQSWRYLAESGTRHLGPVAEDFHAAFGLGDSDAAIGTVDADGVALTAIQGLNRKLEDENARLRADISALRDEFARLRSMVDAAGPDQ